MASKHRLVVFTTTSYASLDDYRAKLAAATVEACARRGIPIVVCDASPDSAVPARLRELGGIVFGQEFPHGGKGGALREALARAVQISTESMMLAFQEPEKAAMVGLWEAVRQRADECRAGTGSGPGTVVVPTRNAQLFEQTYPAEQVQAELFLNSALNTLLAECGLTAEPPFDLAFGPFALDRSLAAHWLSYNGSRWDAQLIGVLRAWRAGALVCSVEVAYRHPPEQTLAEQGQLAWILKRHEQLAFLVPAVRAELAPELATAAELATAKRQRREGSADSTRLIVITGAGGNLGLKLARFFLLRTDDAGESGGVRRPQFCVRLADRLPAAEVRRRLLEPPFGSAPELAAAIAERAELVEIDLSVWSEALESLMAGASAVIHLAAVNPFPDARWSECAQSCDMHALAMHAAVRARVQRFVLASSNHVLGNHWRDGACALRGAPMISGASELRPGTEYDLQPLAQMSAMPYAAAKLFGERLGACVAQYSAMEVIAVRIGWCQPGANKRSTLSVTGSPMVEVNNDVDVSVRRANGADGGALEARRAEIELWFKNMWLSNRDLERLFMAAVDAQLPELPAGTGAHDALGWAPTPAHRPFVLVNGMSANRGGRWCLENAIGYVPLDDVHAPDEAAPSEAAAAPPEQPSSVTKPRSAR